MHTFEDILPFGVGPWQEQSPFLPTGYSPWRSGSAFHFLRLLKLLGVEQQSIATYLGATVSSVSMWVNQHRGTPAKFREPLRAYAGAMFRQAFERHHKERQGLPPDQRRAVEIEFLTLLRQWDLEIQRDLGALYATVQAECRQVGTFADKTTLSAEERRALLYLCQSLQRQLETLGDLDSAPEEPDEGHGVEK